MEEYRPPKLLGNKTPLNCLVQPDQHHAAWKATQRYNMSFGEYVGALIDRAEGRLNKLDGMQYGAMPIEQPRGAAKDSSHKSDTLSFSENKSPEGGGAGDSFGPAARDIP